MSATSSETLTFDGVAYNGPVTSISDPVRMRIDEPAVTYSADTPVAESDTAFAKNDMLYLYLMSTLADCHITFHAADSGSNTVIALTANEPFLWIKDKGTNPLTTDCTQISILNDGSQQVTTRVLGFVGL